MPFRQMFLGTGPRFLPSDWDSQGQDSVSLQTDASGGVLSLSYHKGDPYRARMLPSGPLLL